jgi:hypothetical protein
MSDNYIIIIPKEPNFVPSKDAQRKAVELFKKLAPRANEIKAEVSKTIRFIDCGENFIRVFCSKCNHELDLDWWQSWMGEESEGDFPLRTKSLPCCGAMLTLNELAYDWPQGFARFALEAMNPDIADLKQIDLQQFEKILGCPVRKILQHI